MGHLCSNYCEHDVSLSGIDISQEQLAEEMGTDAHLGPTMPMLFRYLISIYLVIQHQLMDRQAIA